jgi:hypothetical protein
MFEAKDNDDESNLDNDDRCDRPFIIRDSSLMTNDDKLASSPQVPVIMHDDHSEKTAIKTELLHDTAQVDYNSAQENVIPFSSNSSLSKKTAVVNDDKLSKLSIFHEEDEEEEDEEASEHDGAQDDDVAAVHDSSNYTVRPLREDAVEAPSIRINSSSSKKTSITNDDKLSKLSIFHEEEDDDDDDDKSDMQEGEDTEEEKEKNEEKGDDNITELEVVVKQHKRVLLLISSFCTDPVQVSIHTYIQAYIYTHICTVKYILDNVLTTHVYIIRSKISGEWKIFSVHIK